MEAIPSYFIYELSIGRPKQVGLEVVLVVAPAAERLLKLVHVDPEIRRVLGALAHRHRLVVRAACNAALVACANSVRAALNGAERSGCRARCGVGTRG